MSDRSDREKLLIEELFQALWSATVEEIRDKMNARGLVSVDKVLVEHLLKKVRANPDKFGFTVPHVCPGKPFPGDDTRFFPMMKDKDGYYLDAADKAHIFSGLLSTIKRVIRQSLNCAIALSIAAVHSRSKSYVQSVEDLAKDFSDLARRAKRVQRDIIQADGTQGP